MRHLALLNRVEDAVLVCNNMEPAERTEAPALRVCLMQRFSVIARIVCWEQDLLVQRKPHLQLSRDCIWQAPPPLPPQACHGAPPSDGEQDLAAAVKGHWHRERQVAAAVSQLLHRPEQDIQEDT